MNRIWKHTVKPRNFKSKTSATADSCLDYWALSMHAAQLHFYIFSLRSPMEDLINKAPSVIRGLKKPGVPK